MSAHFNCQHVQLKLPLWIKVSIVYYTLCEISISFSLAYSDGSEVSGQDLDWYLVPLALVSSSHPWWGPLSCLLFCVDMDLSPAAVVFLQVETVKSGMTHPWPRAFPDVCTPRDGMLTVTQSAVLWQPKNYFQRLPPSHPREILTQLFKSVTSSQLPPSLWREDRGLFGRTVGVQPGCLAGPCPHSPHDKGSKCPLPSTCTLSCEPLGSVL